MAQSLRTLVVSASGTLFLRGMIDSPGGGAGAQFDNAGFFAVHANAPHWGEWAPRSEAAIRRTQALVPDDQLAPNHAVHGEPWRAGAARGAEVLDPSCNWICDWGLPMWNDGKAAFCKLYAPSEPTGSLHLAGPAKRTAYDRRRAGGGSFRTVVRRVASPLHPVTASRLDYSAGPLHAAA